MLPVGVFFFFLPCSQNVAPVFLPGWLPDPAGCGWCKDSGSFALKGWDVVPPQGLGRRRIEGSLPNTQNLIDWIPLKEELQRERPLISSYQSDFRSKDKVPQLLVHHTYQTFQGQPLYRTPSTTYQRTYRSYNLRPPIISILSEQEVAKEPEPTKPVPCEPTPPSDSEPAAPAPCQPPETTECTTTEAPAPGPIYGRLLPHKKARLTVSDCLRWHNC